MSDWNDNIERAEESSEKQAWCMEGAIAVRRSASICRERIDGLVESTPSVAATGWRWESTV